MAFGNNIAITPSIGAIYIPGVLPSPTMVASINRFRVTGACALLAPASIVLDPSITPTDKQQYIFDWDADIVLNSASFTLLGRTLTEDEAEQKSIIVAVYNATLAAFVVKILKDEGEIEGTETTTLTNAGGTFTIDILKNEVVRRTLLYQDGLDKGLDRNEEVIKALDKTKRDLLVMELIKESTQKMDVSSQEIEDYYNTYKEQLKEPEERQVSEIIVPNEQDAKEILIQLLQGGDFATIAKEKSQGSSAKNGGDLGFIKKGVKPKQFDEVAFSESLDAGKISSIFKGTDGYYIIKVEAKRGGKQKPLSEMWDDIKRGLTFLKQQKAIEDMIGKLSRDAKIEIYEGEIK